MTIPDLSAFVRASSSSESGKVILPLMILIVLAFVVAIIAQQKNRNFGLWLLYGFFLHIIALIHAISLQADSVGSTSRNQNPADDTHLGDNLFIAKGVKIGDVNVGKEKLLDPGEDLCGVFLSGAEPTDDTAASQDDQQYLVTVYLFVTTKRIVFWTKKGSFLTEEKISSYFLEDVQGVQHSSDGNLRILVAARRLSFTINPDEIGQASNLIKRQMKRCRAESKTMSLVESIPDQIRKLAELKESNALTEEEFTVKKNHLLSQITPANVSSVSTRASEIQSAINKMAALVADGYLSVNDYKRKKEELLKSL